MLRKDRRSKSLYVVKSRPDPAADLAPRKQSETRSIYVLRTNDETVNKYCDVIYDFLEQGGIFLLLTRDKIFQQTVKNALCHELGLDANLLRVIQDTADLGQALDKYLGRDQKPFLFMEHALNGQLTLPQLQYIAKTWPDLPVVVVARDVFQERLFQFHEEGADNFLTKPASTNTVIEKIAFTLQPHCEVDALLVEGRHHLVDNHFDEAIDIANTVLLKHPQHPAALVLLGDGFKGLAKRQEALRAYKDAEKNAKMYLEPLKRLVLFHAEDNDVKGMLGYLVKLDKLSPLNCNRKIKIAELHIDMGQAAEAEKYFDKAIDSAREEAMSVVSEMCLDIADMVAESNPQMAEKYYRKSLEMTKSSRGALCMNIYNRLGISLRRQGMWSEAVEAYFEAEKYAPKDENIQYNIALAYSEGGENKKAVERLLRALNVNPVFYVGRSEVAAHMATIFKAAGMAWQALEFFRRQKAAGQDDPQIAQLMALLSSGGS
ncbi:MAG TPA: tetratricopeptide repeat protein [Desulfovibrio sp.]|jgi:tetratricopeptide (TPR) repeat protein|uniref:tetratricopeptide repeat protein n=1 Tax=Desulfovibrio TaxID=872 RepID=UPI002A453C5B|nr:tetratricopeptide repeat protein [Desulfovibrio sp.]MDY0305035.1 tetratricopeptide repeat protein [Desulfovibrionaceae bacterium]HMM37768.1 tetratricopeptide repeat protein [Desulfovibrio sp.]